MKVTVTFWRNQDSYRYDRKSALFQFIKEFSFLVDFTLKLADLDKQIVQKIWSCVLFLWDFIFAKEKEMKKVICNSRFYVKTESYLTVTI